MTLREYMVFQGLSGFYNPGGLECQLPNLPGVNFKVLPDGETFMMWNRSGLSVTGGARLMDNIFASGDLSAPDPDLVDALTGKTELISPKPEVTSDLSDSPSEAGHGIGDSEDSEETGSVDAVKADTEVATPPVSSDPLDDLEADMLSPTLDVSPKQEDALVDSAETSAALVEEEAKSTSGVPFRKVRPAKGKSKTSSP